MHHELLYAHFNTKNKILNLQVLEWRGAQLPVAGVTDSVVTAALDSDRIGVHVQAPGPSSRTEPRGSAHVYVLVLDSVSRLTAARELPRTGVSPRLPIENQ